MAEFSLDLNEDQQQIQKWVHDFAEQVVRPAGHEWDEKEETPWPVIEEAAKIGLYSWEFMAQCFSDPTGLLFPVVSEEMCWGDAGISLAIFGSTLGAAGIAGNGTPEQIAEWVPQCFGTADDIHPQRWAPRPAQRARGGGQRRPRPRLTRPRLLRRPAGHVRAHGGKEGEEDGHPRLAHRRGAVRRRTHPELLFARRRGEARGPTRPGA